jgi:hypothetical protein
MIRAMAPDCVTRGRNAERAAQFIEQAVRKETASGPESQLP